MHSTIHPALASTTGELQANDDGSQDLYSGPTAPDGHDANRVQTLPSSD